MKEKSALHKVFRRLRQFENLARVECGFEFDIARTEKCREKMIEEMWDALDEANRKGLEGFKLKERR